MSLIKNSSVNRTFYPRKGMQPVTSFLAVIALFMPAGVAAAQPGEPVYVSDWTDCVTSDNRFVGGDGIFYWDVDPDCDDYQRDEYERPMTQSFYHTQGRYGAVEYFEYLDLVGARAGFDERFLYVQLQLAGRNHLTSDGTVIPLGMVERYGFRLSTDADGRFGLLIVADQPELKNEPNTVFGQIGTFGYRDTNGDVGGADRDGPTGLTVTKTDNPDEEGGTLDGYDTPLISDGRLDDETPVLWVRLHPDDDTLVEFALDYLAVGFSSEKLSALGYLHFEAIKGGPKDPQNYLWNDKYSKVEAGSPNPGPNGESEFGTEGLENIYEVDTLAGGSIAEGPSDPSGDPGDGTGDGGTPNGDDGGQADPPPGITLCGNGVFFGLPLAVVGWLSCRARGGRVVRG